MNEIINDDFPDYRKVYIDLINRCKQAKEWTLFCYIEESWVPRGNIPFDMMMRDGVAIARVIAPTEKDAMIVVADNLPVIKFIDPDIK